MSGIEVRIPIFLWAPLPILVAVTGLCLVIGIVTWALPHVVLRLGPHWMPQPPFHAPIVGLFGLLLSFTAIDAWQRNGAALTALLRESQEASALVPLLDALAQTGQAGAITVRQGLIVYLHKSLDGEWASHNTQASPAAGAALNRMRAVTAVGLTAGGPSAPGWRAVQDRLDGLQQGRAARLVAGSLYGDLLRWAALVALCAAAAFSVAAVHIGRPKASALALGIYLFVAVMALSLVAMTEHPYTGWDEITPEPLVDVLTQIETRPPSP